MKDKEAVKVSAKVMATNNGNITFAGTNAKGEETGVITCTKSQLAGTVTMNTGTEAKFNVESVSFSGTEMGGKCSDTIIGVGPVQVIAENLPWCFSSTVIEIFSIRGGSCAAGASPVKLTIVGMFATCTYERTTLGGSYVKNSPPAVLAMVSQQAKLAKGGGACPPEGDFTGLYSLTTEAEPANTIQFI
jgi:hypothetical protein